MKCTLNDLKEGDKFRFLGSYDRMTVLSFEMDGVIVKYPSAEFSTFPYSWKVIKL